MKKNLLNNFNCLRHDLILLTGTLFLLLSSHTAFSQVAFNESGELGIHAGFNYKFVTRDLLLDPGVLIRYHRNLFLISNEFLLYKGRILESSLALTFRNYPFGNYKRMKAYLSGELQYMHTEGYYNQTRHVKGGFLIIGTGLHYDIINNIKIGIEAGFGPGITLDSKRYENNTLIVKTKYAFTISWTLK